MVVIQRAFPVIGYPIQPVVPLGVHFTTLIIDWFSQEHSSMSVLSPFSPPSIFIWIHKFRGSEKRKILSKPKKYHLLSFSQAVCI